MSETIVNPQLRALLGPQIGRTEFGLETPSAGAERPADAKSFAETLQESINEVNQLQVEADEAIEQLVTGQRNDLHGTMIALEKADLSFKLMMEVRNKILSAYQEVMRMG